MKPFLPAPIKPIVSAKEIERIDIRAGTVEAVYDVPGSDKLVCLTVDFGDAKRTVLVGMKTERDDPGKIVGIQALFVVNVAPREMFGIRSEAMLFDIGYADGLTPALACPERPIPNGARAG